MSGRRRVWAARRCPSPGARPPAESRLFSAASGTAALVACVSSMSAAAARGPRRFYILYRQLERGDAYGRSYDDEAPQHLAAAASGC